MTRGKETPWPYQIVPINDRGVFGIAKLDGASPAGEPDAVFDRQILPRRDHYRTAAAAKGALTKALKSGKL